MGNAKNAQKTNYGIHLQNLVNAQMINIKSMVNVFLVVFTKLTIKMTKFVNVILDSIKIKDRSSHVQVAIPVVEDVQAPKNGNVSNVQKLAIHSIMATVKEKTHAPKVFT